MNHLPKLSKIINDPVHGFIEINNPLVLQLINHPIYQRLRRISQLALSSEVYPGAVHTRFIHALGAMHLMTQALDTLRKKEVEITPEEYEAAQIAILLHDVGHGPFSHSLEKEIITNLHHEDMSAAFMHKLNQEFEGKLELAIAIFEGKHPKKFLHQLVSSQLDMDRMDYLMRDSFFTGVVEGVIGADRLIKTLNVYENQLVVESKGIYSVENFIVSRRLMYWQVYLHKASISSENMLIRILRRARHLFEAGKEDLFLGGALRYFFQHKVDKNSLTDTAIQQYMLLDDHDILYAIKQWQHDSDGILAKLSKDLLHRKLFKTQLRSEPYSKEEIKNLREQYAKANNISVEEAQYFVIAGDVSNMAYNKDNHEPIWIWYKSGEIKELAAASDMQNVTSLSKEVVKYYLCMPS
ncbi:MAG: HD domain-containing protein [Bacteroidia bacterium]